MDDGTAAISFHLTLQLAEAGKFVRLDRILPAGTLEARKSKREAITFYWRGAVGPQTVRVPIGLYDSRASPKSVNPTAAGYSIEAARRVAERIAQEHAANRASGGYKAIRDARREREKQALQDHADASEHTLEKLLLAYCDHLEKLGRTSHRDARSLLKLHAIEAWPKIAQAPAVALTPEQVADMMRKVLDDGKGRTANKLRTYVRAAFQVAKDARFDARIPVAFKGFKVSLNPAADTIPDNSQNRSGKNPLVLDALVTYWGLIKDEPGLRGALLRLHLLTGAPRPAQMVRLRTEDITGEAITLFDGKGRPSGARPRPHMLPLIPEAKKSLDAVASGGEFALSSDGGATHITASNLNRWAKEIVGDRIPGFTAKRIRSGVETLLAKRQVTKDIRGRLQSHGISGVQDRHYDGHDYLPEKKRALLVLYATLEGKKAKVSSISKAAA